MIQALLPGDETDLRVTPGAWRLNLTERRLQAPGGHAESMTGLEIVLLKLLASKACQTVTRPEIAQAFGASWIDYDARQREQLVSRLRRRERNSSGSNLPLRTEHGQGYNFCDDLVMH